MAEEEDELEEREEKEKVKVVVDGMDPDAWMVTFSDLLTLMLTFFVMLLTMRTLDSQSIESSFNLMQGGLGILGAAEESAYEPEMLPVVPELTFSPTYVERLLESVVMRDDTREQGTMVHNKEKGIHDESIGFYKNTDGAAKKDRVQDNLRLKREKLKRLGIEVNDEKSRLVIRINDKLMFKSGSTALTEESKRILFALGQKLKESKAKIKILGHTDDTMVKSEYFNSNLELSVYRSINIVKYLTSMVGIDPKRLSAYGYGEHHPLVVNINEKNRSLNRRIEIAIDKTDMDIDEKGNLLLQKKKIKPKLGDGTVKLPAISLGDE
ncbi:MAG: OmpA family protein [Nitrospinae bacterium]|nr:OmpA family protein [Nitrospinota bacterium]